MRDMVANDVALLMRTRLEDGTRAYVTPAIAKNGKIKPLAALIDGKAEPRPDAVYASVTGKAS